MTTKHTQATSGGLPGMLTSAILRTISYLDYYGAQTWNLRYVAVISACILYAIYKLGRTKKGETRGGICWEGLIHAAISGLCSSACVYLDHFAAEAISGSTEPLRSIRCEGPLTSLHRILPAITLGYAICDMIEAIDLGVDFLLHASALFVVMLTVCELGVSHTVTPMLMMELSSIPFNLVSATSMTPTGAIVMQALFALSFFAVRVFIVPYIWLEWLYTFYKEEQLEDENMCFPHFFIYVVLLFGIVFNGLNLYWFVKIVKKVKRKLRGSESMREADIKNR